MDVTVSVEQGNVPITILHVDGDIDSATDEKFEQIALKEIDNGARYILLDLSSVAFIGSAGFRTIMKMLKRLRSLSAGTKEVESIRENKVINNKSPNLKLYKISKLVSETMKLAGFATFLEVYEDMHTAIASFQETKIASS